jgi:hypothetical protein
MFAGAPLFGIGWGQFGWHHFMLTGKEGHALTGLYNHAHNLILQVLAETGIVGGGITLAGMALWARNAACILRRPEGLWLWACALVLGVHSMLEYPLWNTYFLGIAAIVLGLAETRTLMLQRASLVRMTVAIFVTSCAWAGGIMLDSYYRLESVIDAHYAVPDRRVLERAHREMVDVTASFFLAPYVELAYARDIDLGTALLESKIAFTTRVMHFAPTGLVAYRYAALNALAGRDAEASDVLQQAVRAYPHALEGFIREFAAVATGNPEVQRRFLAELRRLDSKQKREELTLSK